MQFLIADDRRWRSKPRDPNLLSLGIFLIPLIIFRSKLLPPFAATTLYLAFKTIYCEGFENVFGDADVQSSVEDHRQIVAALWLHGCH